MRCIGVRGLCYVQEAIGAWLLLIQQSELTTAFEPLRIDMGESLGALDMTLPMYTRLRSSTLRKHSKLQGYSMLLNQETATNKSCMGQVVVFSSWDSDIFYCPSPLYTAQFNRRQHFCLVSLISFRSSICAHSSNFHITAVTPTQVVSICVACMWTVHSMSYNHIFKLNLTQSYNVLQHLSSSAVLQRSTLVSRYTEGLVSASGVSHGQRYVLYLSLLTFSWRLNFLVSSVEWNMSPVEFALCGGVILAAQLSYDERVSSICAMMHCHYCLDRCICYSSIAYCYSSHVQVHRISKTKSVNAVPTSLFTVSICCMRIAATIPAS